MIDQEPKNPMNDQISELFLPFTYSNFFLRLAPIRETTRSCETAILPRYREKSPCSLLLLPWYHRLLICSTLRPYVKKIRTTFLTTSWITLRHIKWFWIPRQHKTAHEWEWIMTILFLCSGDPSRLTHKRTLVFLNFYRIILRVPPCRYVLAT